MLWGCRARGAQGRGADSSGQLSRSASGGSCPTVRRQGRPLLVTRAVFAGRRRIPLLLLLGRALISHRPDMSWLPAFRRSEEGAASTVASSSSPPPPLPPPPPPPPSLTAGPDEKWPGVAVPLAGFGLGFVSGLYHAANRSSLVFMAENAHRRPDTVQGWYFYNKTKVRLTLAIQRI